MIYYSHHNFVRLRRERNKKIITTLSVFSASMALGFSLFF